MLTLGLGKELAPLDSQHNAESKVPGPSSHLDSIPVLAGKGILGLLLETLLALRQSLVSADGSQQLPWERSRLSVESSLEKTYLPTAIVMSTCLGADECADTGCWLSLPGDEQVLLSRNSFCA